MRRYGQAHLIGNKGDDEAEEVIELHAHKPGRPQRASSTVSVRT